jgi:peptidyl-prolyl cis-trans isomerase C
MCQWLPGRRALARAGFICCALIAASSSGQAHHTPPRAAAPSDDPAEVARRSQTVASFEGGSVTLGELEDAILDQNPLMQERYRTADGVHAVLDRSVRFALLAAEAQRRGYDKAPPVVLAANQSAVQQLIQHDFDNPITPESVPEAEVEKYYAAHLDEFVRGEGRRASMIVLADLPAAEAMFAKVQHVDLRGFRELARAHSLDEMNKQRGGDLPFFDAQGKGFEAPDTAIDPAIAKATFALTGVGETSRPVQVGERYAIVRFSGTRAARDDTLREAADRIKQRLWRDRRQAAIDARVEELKKQQHYIVRRELIEAVKLDSGPPLPPGDGLPGGFPHTPESPAQKTSLEGAEPR